MSKTETACVCCGRRGADVSTVVVTGDCTICEDCADVARVGFWTRQHPNLARILPWLWRSDTTQESWMLRAIPGIVITWGISEQVAWCCLPMYVNVPAILIAIVGAAIVVMPTLLVVDSVAGRYSKTGFVLWALVWGLAGAWLGRSYPAPWGTVIATAVGLALWIVIERSTRSRK